jgi:hypothetical protein
MITSFYISKALLLEQCSEAFHSDPRFIHTQFMETKAFELFRHIQAAYTTFSVPDESARTFRCVCTGLSTNELAHLCVHEAIFKTVHEPGDLSGYNLPDTIKPLLWVHSSQHIFSFSHHNLPLRKRKNTVPPPTKEEIAGRER